VVGPFLVVKHAEKHLRESDRGRVVNIGSIGGKRPYPNRLAYAASKMALIGMTRTMAYELGRDGVTANTVLPGPVEGPRIEEMVEKQAELATVDRAEPLSIGPDDFALADYMMASEEIAEQVAYLASEHGRHITAQEVTVGDVGDLPDQRRRDARVARLVGTQQREARLDRPAVAREADHRLQPLPPPVVDRHLRRGVRPGVPDHQHVAGRSDAPDRVVVRLYRRRVVVRVAVELVDVQHSIPDGRLDQKLLRELYRGMDRLVAGERRSEVDQQLAAPVLDVLHDSAPIFEARPHPASEGV